MNKGDLVVLKRSLGLTGSFKVLNFDNVSVELESMVDHTTMTVLKNSVVRFNPRNLGDK